MNYLELKHEVLKYFDLNPDKAEEYKEELSILKDAWDFPAVIFPNPLTKEILNLEYIASTIETEQAFSKVTLREVHVKDNEAMKLYFPEEYTEQDAINATMLLYAEQSMMSAHKYCKAPQNTTVFDVGSSEGFFSKVYCDETNEIRGFDEPMWIHAYLETTRGLNSSICPSFVDKDFKVVDPITKPLGCIKIDTEGMEIEVLTAFEPWIEEFHPMIQAAVYHYAEEADEVVHWLKEKGYKNFGQVVKDKKMLFNNDIQRPPFFRYGVIIATM